MSQVEDILRLLKNGKWHDLEEIEKKIQLRDFNVTNITKFLSQYNFIKLDKEGKKVKLDPSTQDFLKKIRQLEGKEKL